MQRLFSTFPNGLPGIGLLLLRLSCASAPLLVDSSNGARIASGLVAAVILGGIWTPVAASCQAIVQFGIVLGGIAFDPIPLLFAVNSVSLALLGPGAWSIDARLYGRKRIDLGPA